jgi:hypothetical protein
LPILKEQPKQAKNALIQVRVEEEIKTNLDQYAEFIHSNQAWVVSEALRLLFRKDRDFQDWRAKNNNHRHRPVEGESPAQGALLR